MQHNRSRESLPGMFRKRCCSDYYTVRPSAHSSIILPYTDIAYLQHSTVFRLQRAATGSQGLAYRRT